MANHYIKQNVNLLNLYIMKPIPLLAARSSQYKFNKQITNPIVFLMFIIVAIPDN